VLNCIVLKKVSKSRIISSTVGNSLWLVKKSSFQLAAFSWPITNY